MLERTQCLLFPIMRSEAPESIIQVGKLNEEVQWDYLSGPKWLWKKVEWMMSETARTFDTTALSSAPHWRNSCCQIAPSELWLHEQMETTIAAFLAVVGNCTWCGLALPIIIINHLSYSSSWTTTAVASPTTSSSKITSRAFTSCCSVLDCKRRMIPGLHKGWILWL